MCAVSLCECMTNNNVNQIIVSHQSASHSRRMFALCHSPISLVVKKTNATRCLLLCSSNLLYRMSQPLYVEERKNVNKKTANISHSFSLTLSKWQRITARISYFMFIKHELTTNVRRLCPFAICTAFSIVGASLINDFYFRFFYIRFGCYCHLICNCAVRIHQDIRNDRKTPKRWNGNAIDWEAQAISRRSPDLETNMNTAIKWIYCRPDSETHQKGSCFS